MSELRSQFAKPTPATVSPAALFQRFAPQLAGYPNLPAATLETILDTLSAIQDDDPRSDIHAAVAALDGLLPSRLIMAPEKA
ncbi:MAG: hypothetical protein HOA30_19590 [Rhodospirillaceae bacterium]|nr:hypothetical protein [Rhodospirillaceae bacterium]